MKKCLKAILDFIFPPKCILCGTQDQISKYAYLCGECFESFKVIHEPFCIKCGEPFGSEHTGSHLCIPCRSKRPYFDLARSAGVYEGKLEDAVKLYKYQKKRFLDKPLVNFTVDKLHDLISNAPIDTVVPVPCSLKKLRKRGFDHSYILAKEIAKRFHFSIDYKSLYKSRETQAQVELDYSKRKENPLGSFALRKDHPFKGKSVLLIDDVVTTKSTLNECSRVLKREGRAKRVLCITVARTLVNP